MYLDKCSALGVMRLDGTRPVGELSAEIPAEVWWSLVETPSAK
jgi:hypothetical protein